MNPNVAASPSITEHGEGDGSYTIPLNDVQEPSCATNACAHPKGFASTGWACFVPRASIWDNHSASSQAHGEVTAPCRPSYLTPRDGHGLLNHSLDGPAPVPQVTGPPQRDGATRLQSAHVQND